MKNFFKLLIDQGFTNVGHYAEGWWGYNSHWPMQKWEEWAKEANFPLEIFLKVYVYKN